MPAHWVRGSRTPSKITPTTSRSTPAPGAGTALRWAPAHRAAALSAPGSSVVPRLAQATPPMCLAYMSKAAVSLQMRGPGGAGSLMPFRTSQVTLARNSTFKRARVEHSPLRHRVSALIPPAIAGTSTSSRSMHQGWQGHRRKLVPPILPIRPVCTFRCEDVAHRPCVSVLFPHFQMCQ